MVSFHRPRPIPLIMTLCGVLLMLGLGVWQLQRLAWKEQLIATIATAQQAAPLRQLPATLEEATQKAFHTVVLQGHYLPEYAFHVAARYFKSQLGYHVFVPFQADSGEVVLVNRGWIPARLKDTVDEPKPTGRPATLRALIRVGNDRNAFTPANQPQDTIWFGRDVTAMAQHVGITVLPYSLDRIGTQDIRKLPVPSDGRIALRNDHLNYAITWFSIGLGMLVISLLYHRKNES